MTTLARLSGPARVTCAHPCNHVLAFVLSEPMQDSVPGHDNIYFGPGWECGRQDGTWRLTSHAQKLQARGKEPRSKRAPVFSAPSDWDSQRTVLGESWRPWPRLWSGLVVGHLVTAFPAEVICPRCGRILVLDVEALRVVPATPRPGPDRLTFEETEHGRQPVLRPVQAPSGGRPFVHRAVGVEHMLRLVLDSAVPHV